VTSVYTSQVPSSVLGTSHQMHTCGAINYHRAEPKETPKIVYDIMYSFAKQSTGSKKLSHI